MDYLSTPTLQERQAAFAASFNLSFNEYMLVLGSCTMEEVVTVLELMKVRNPKSLFKASAQKQVRRWLALGMKSKPMSRSQFASLEPKYPIKWELPK